MKSIITSTLAKLSASCVAAIAAATSAAAVEGIGNLDQIMPVGGIGDIQGIPPGGAASVTFRTGSGNDPLNFVEFEFYGLTDAIRTELQLQLHNFLPPPWVDTSPLCDLTGAVIDPAPTQWPGDTTFVKFFPSTPVVLEPDSYYWVTIKNPLESPEWAALMYVNWTFDYSGICDWRMGPFHLSGSLDGAEWNWNESSIFPPKFRVDVTYGSGQPPHCNQPPDVTHAYASVDSLWPPNGQMKPVRILGITDPDGDTVQVDIQQVRQDEPTSALSKGDAGPDATGLNTDTALLKAERNPKGNGRVYNVWYRAHDGKAESFGYVVVTVPHALGNGRQAIDDGQFYLSDQP